MASRHDTAMSPVMDVAAITTSGTAQSPTLVFSEASIAGFYMVTGTQPFYMLVGPTGVTATTNSALIGAYTTIVVQVPPRGNISILQGPLGAGQVNITGMR